MRKQQPDVLKILIIVMAGIIAAFAIFMVIFLTTASKKLKGIELSPDFAYNELEVGTQYTFTIKATPKKASLKKLEAVVDDSSCSFEIDDDKAILTTGLNEGTVTVYIQSKDIKSQVLTFGVVDSVARAEAEAAAAAQAEAEAAAAQAEAEAAAAEAEATTKYVKCIGDDVRVRAQNNTDCDILGKAKNGECFEKVEDVDDWTHIIYKGQDAYMKTEFLTEVSEEEAMSAPEPEPEEEKKTEEKKQEEKKPENTEASTQSKEEAEAKAAAAAQAEAEAAAQAALEAAAAAQAAQAAAGFTINCADGPHTFSQQKYNFIKGFWSYTGDWEAMAHKHTESELNLICQIEGGIN